MGCQPPDLLKRAMERRRTKGGEVFKTIFVEGQLCAIAVRDPN